MASWPAYALVGFPQAEEPESALMRSEMERGPAKQRRVTADVTVTQELTAYFNTKQAAVDWETWFYTTINAGADYFDFTDLRTGITRQVRIKEGRPGPLKPATVNWAYSQRTMTIEWQRSAL